MTINCLSVRERVPEPVPMHLRQLVAAQRPRADRHARSFGRTEADGRTRIRLHGGHDLVQLLVNVVNRLLKAQNV